MNVISSDVFVGVLTKSFNVEKGFKGLLELPDKQIIGITVGYDGKLSKGLSESVGKTVLLVGDLSFSKDKMPVLTVRERLNGGGLVVKRGRLARDPELKYTPDGKSYTLFSIAVNRGFGDRKETYFVNCTIFGNENEKNPALTIAEKAKKGQEIIVKGRLSTNKGKERTFYNLIVSEFEFLFNAPKSKDEEKDPYEDYADLGAEISLDDLDDIDIINSSEGSDEIPF